MQSIEQWRSVPGYEGYYEVSDHGRVRRFGSDRLLKTRTSRDGYQMLSFSVRSKQTLVRVHRLVALTFLGPGEPGTEVCHYNGDPSDNRLSNLRWDTHRANMRDMMRTGAPHLMPKAICRNGLHAMTPDNTVKNGGGRRLCRTCRNARQAVWSKARRAREVAS